MAGSDPERIPQNYPTSVITLDFSATLDELFSLDSIGDLELSLEQKKDDVRSQERQLEDLHARLKEATEKLKELESRHRGMKNERPLRSQHRPVFNSSSDSENGCSDGNTSSSAFSSRHERTH